MAIYKAKQQTHYAQIPNATLRDKRLSFEARGVLAMLLSLPEDWGINIAWICKQSPNSGRDRVSRILKELQECGYMVKRVKQGEKGKLDGVDWDVYLEPVSLETRNTVNPSPGESATTKKELNKEKVITNISSSFDDAVSDAFETFWSAGMKKVSKKTALAKFKNYVKKNNIDPADFAGKLFIDIQARIKSGQMGFENMHPTTYLNQERWNDEVSTGNSAPANSRGQSYSHERHQAELEQWKQTMLNGGDGQRCDALGQNAGDLRGEVEPGSWGDTADGYAISLDDGDWQTEP